MKFIAFTLLRNGPLAKSRAICTSVAAPSPGIWMSRRQRLPAGVIAPVSLIRLSRLSTICFSKIPTANAPVIAQRLLPLGFDGGITIVKDYLRTVRQDSPTRRAYVRVEPAPGERFDIDWGHFGALIYNGATRKLYAFCLVESHSRKMYLEFTHSQTFETFVRCHIHAFHEFGGCARELWFDNLATAVAEHDGNLVRFNPRFLAFAREYNFLPRACHVAAAWEKGKVERAIGYVRQNFWPLRSFTDLADVNLQARRWLQRDRQPAPASRNRSDSGRMFST